MSEKKKSDLLPRLVTAIVALPLLLALLFWAPSWAFLILVSIAGAISAWEYCTITYSKELPGGAWVTALVTCGVIHAIYWLDAAFSLWVLIGAAVVLFLYFLFAHADQPRSTHQLGSSITAVVYAGGMLSGLALLHTITGAAGPLWVVLGLGIIWGSDTGAYFAGKAFGKHKLYPSVSPNKTVEGALGGMVSSVLITFGFDALFAATSEAWPLLEAWHIVVLAIVANFLGQTGDLCESLIKRAHGVKDSGTIIYGHGGMLDRIDALIFASPWFYVFTAFILDYPKG